MLARRWAKMLKRASSSQQKSDSVGTTAMNLDQSRAAMIAFCSDHGIVDVEVQDQCFPVTVILSFKTGECKTWFVMQDQMNNS